MATGALTTLTRRWWIQTLRSASLENSAIDSAFRCLCSRLAANLGSRGAPFSTGTYPPSTEKGCDKSKRAINGESRDSQFDLEMDAFLLTKALEEGESENRLVNSAFSTKAIQQALSLCDFQLSRSKSVPSVEASEGLDHLPTAIASEKQQHGMIQDLLDSFGQLHEGEGAIDGAFGNWNRDRGDRESLVETPKKLKSLSEDRELQRVPPLTEGGFRTNIYRNVTGSVKILLTSIRGQILQKVLNLVKQDTESPNGSLMERLIEGLKLTDAPRKADLRPEMNQIGVAVLDKLSALAPHELALVCLVFGQIGYTNSLVFFQVFSELQKSETMQSMDTDVLCGVILSLGMLQSTEPELVTAVQEEFYRRLENRAETPVPHHSFGCLLLGSCHLKGQAKAISLTSALLDVLCEESMILDSSIVSWSDLAIAVYVAAEAQISKPALLKGLHKRLIQGEGSRDLNSTEVAVLLLSLEKMSRRITDTLLFPVWKASYTALEDAIGALLSEGSIEPNVVPDLVRSLSFPKLERPQYFEALGRHIIQGDTLNPELPLWPLIFRLMSGYANLLYRDPVMLKALNKRILSTKFAYVSGSTVAQLLHLGFRLRGLEEAVVDRLEDLISTPFFWNRLYRAKDAGRIAYSLAGFEKLTPLIFKHCCKRAAAIVFNQQGTMGPQESIDTLFVAQGLFDGYQFIERRFSAEEAQKCLSEKDKKTLYALIRRKNLADSGPQTEAQRAVAECLRDMGVSLTFPALIVDGLYRADMALHDEPVSPPRC